MYKLIYTNQFLKDVELCKKRNYNTDLLRNIITKLEADKSLEIKHKEHLLKGDYAGCKECHIKSDWLLIWDVDSQNNKTYPHRNPF